MRFNDHRKLSGLHAPFTASQSAWLRYDDDKILEVYANKKAAEMGTRLHNWAAETINLGLKQPKSKKTICAYVNDAIGFKMDTEVGRLRLPLILAGSSDGPESHFNLSWHPFLPDECD